MSTITTPDTHTILKTAMTVLGTSFTATAFYIYFFEAPSRRVLPAKYALLQRDQSFKRVACWMGGQCALQAILGLAGGAALNSGKLLTSGVLAAGIPLYTLTAMMPINQLLMKYQLPENATYEEEKKVHQRLDEWAFLHSARIVLGAASVAVLIFWDTVKNFTETAM